MENSHTFFRNAACQYFPCHRVEDDAEFNCLFCFCPLYMLPDCGGDGVVRGAVKDCTPCTVPHRPGGYEHVIERLKRWHAEQREGKEG
jgi:Zn-finger protein